MLWASRRSLIACVGLAGVVVVAYAVGRAGLYSLIGPGSLAAVALSFAAVLRPAERIAGATLLAWVVLATVTQQFAWAASGGGVFVAAVWLVPPIAGGAYLPAAGRWRSGMGCWAASFAGVAATTFSIHSIHSGTGLMSMWRS